MAADPEAHIIPAIGPTQARAVSLLGNLTQAIEPLHQHHQEKVKVRENNND